MSKPPILEEIRRVRRAMSAEIGHDPAKITDYFAAIQRRQAHRLVNLADQGPYGRSKHNNAVTEKSLPDSGSTPANR